MLLFCKARQLLITVSDSTIDYFIWLIGSFPHDICLDFSFQYQNAVALLFIVVVHQKYSTSAADTVVNVAVTIQKNKIKTSIDARIHNIAASQIS